MIIFINRKFFVNQIIVDKSFACIYQISPPRTGYETKPGEYCKFEFNVFLVPDLLSYQG